MQAGLLIIGDELLSGRTRDSNTVWLATRLEAIGLPVVEVRIVSDGPAHIQGSVWELQERRDADVVITCGGLGPTHDDRTVAAMAALHAVPLIRHEPTYAWLAERHAALHREGRRAGPDMTRASEKMSRVPQGAEVFRNEAGAAPGLLLERRLASREGSAWTVVLPGVPQEVQTLWSSAVEARLVAICGKRTQHRHTRELVYLGYESEAAEVLEAVARTHSDVAIGSYPHWGKKEVVLRVTGRETEGVEAACRALRRALLDAGHVVTARPLAPNP